MLASLAILHTEQTMNKKINILDRGRWFAEQGFSRAEIVAITRFLLQVALDTQNFQGMEELKQLLRNEGESMFRMMPGDYALALAVIRRLPREFWEV